MPDLKLPAIQLVQNGCKIFVTCLRAKDAIRIGKIDYWLPSRPDGNQGYQREPKPSHLRRIAKFILGKLYPTKILPTAILMNSRNDLQFHASEGEAGTLTINGNQTLWIVDGQHRIEGLKYAIQDQGASELGEFPLPVVITENLDRYAEMLQFFVINTEQKRIRTDLANRLLQQQAKETDGYARLVDQGIEWKVRATAVTDRLNRLKDSIWNGCIQAPNEKKNARHVVKEVSFSTSLRPVIAGNSILSKLHVDQVAAVLDRYWKALEKLLPEAFSDPDEYVIQKTPGVFSLHSIFPLVFELARQQSDTLSVEAFAKVLRPMVEETDGSEFWRSDNEEDGAAQYGSMKGFRILANKLEALLPKVRVKI